MPKHFKVFLMGYFLAQRHEQYIYIGMLSLWNIFYNQPLFSARLDTINSMAGLFLIRLSRDVMVVVMQHLENPTALDNLLTADPDLRPLYACYQQSIDMEIARNYLSHSFWSAMRDLVTIQSSYRQPQGAPPASPNTFTDLEASIFKEIISLRGRWRCGVKPISDAQNPTSSDLALCRFWILLWACIPETKDKNAKARETEAARRASYPLEPPVRVKKSWDAEQKRSKYTRKYSKVEKFFEVYHSGGEQGKEELKALHEISWHPSRAMHFDGNAELFKAIQVPGDHADEWDILDILASVVLAHIEYTARLLEVDLVGKKYT
jgi:hypothetical protein